MFANRSIVIRIVRQIVNSGPVECSGRITQPTKCPGATGQLYYRSRKGYTLLFRLPPPFPRLSLTNTIVHSLGYFTYTSQPIRQQFVWSPVMNRLWCIIIPSANFLPDRCNIILELEQNISRYLEWRNEACIKCRENDRVIKWIFFFFFSLVKDT